MPREADGGALPAETVDALLRDPEFVAEVRSIRDHIVARYRYAAKWGLETPVDIRGQLASILRGLDNQERDARDREAAEQYEQLREFVQGFRKRGGDQEPANVG